MAYSVHSLLGQYDQLNHKKALAKKLIFTGAEGNDVYNCTAPFQTPRGLYILARVEARDSEQATTVFFRQVNGEYQADFSLPTFPLQDPFITRINGEWILGGVEVFSHPEDEAKLWWKTCFYRGKDINNFEKFFEGPIGMKDIRLCQLPKGDIAVFTRPQGVKGGRGQIGYFEVSDLSELSEANINAAPLLPLFLPEEWGGANEIHVLDENHLGVLGHIAAFEPEEIRHYYAMTFVLKPSTRTVAQVKILATRADFLPGAAKRSDLEDVVFSGGLLRHGQGSATLYAGIGDAEAQALTLPDPFFNLKD